MDKLENITNTIFIIFLILVIYIFYHYYNIVPNDIDENGDGIVTDDEIKIYIKKEIDRRLESPPQFKGVVKSSLSGFFRGFLMGLLLN